MMDRIKENKKVLIIIGVIIIFVIIAVVFGTNSNRVNRPDVAKTSIDKDTGDIIEDAENDPETYNDNSLVNVIGLKSLMDTYNLQMDASQIPVFVTDLTTNGARALTKFDNPLKIVDSKFNEAEYRIESDIIYNTSGNRAKMYINIVDGSEFSYKLFIDGKEIYSSGKLFVNQ